MKRWLLVGGLLFVAIMAFRISERLSADALGMGLGVLFGIIAGVPTAMLVLAAARRKDENTENSRPMARAHQLGYGGPYASLPPQPPVIILAANGMPMQTGQSYAGYETSMPMLTGPVNGAAGRDFRMIGGAESIDDYND
jgi:hypothetical protein